jgi:hypothetical protein
MAKGKLWVITVKSNSTDKGYLVVSHGVVAVYASERDAAKEAKWLNDFHRRIGSGTQYTPSRWQEDRGYRTSLQSPISESESDNSMRTWSEPRKSVGKRSKQRTPEYSEAAPSASIPTDLSELFVGNLATDGTNL